MSEINLAICFTWLLSWDKCGDYDSDMVNILKRPIYNIYNFGFVVGTIFGCILVEFDIPILWILLVVMTAFIHVLQRNVEHYAKLIWEPIYETYLQTFLKRTFSNDKFDDDDNRVASEEQKLE